MCGRFSGRNWSHSCSSRCCALKHAHGVRGDGGHGEALLHRCSRLPFYHWVFLRLWPVASKRTLQIPAPSSRLGTDGCVWGRSGNSPRCGQVGSSMDAASAVASLRLKANQTQKYVSCLGVDGVVNTVGHWDVDSLKHVRPSNGQGSKGRKVTRSIAEIVARNSLSNFLRKSRNIV